MVRPAILIMCRRRCAITGLVKWSRLAEDSGGVLRTGAG
jgi:hypothetical protein